MSRPPDPPSHRHYYPLDLAAYLVACGHDRDTAWYCVEYLMGRASDKQLVTITAETRVRPGDAVMASALALLLQRLCAPGDAGFDVCVTW